MAPRAHPPGVSLPELLTVLTLLGILAGIATPSLAGVLDAHRVRSTLARLAADLAYARMHAVRSGRPTELLLVWDAGGRCVQRYQLRELGGAPRVLREVSVGDLLPRGCLHGNNAGQPLRFDARGLPSRVIARTLAARSGAAADSLVISQLGRMLHRR